MHKMYGSNEIRHNPMIKNRNPLRGLTIVCNICNISIGSYSLPLFLQRDTEPSLSERITMANNPDIITRDWKTSVHTTAFIPLYVIVIKHCVATLVIKTFQHNLGGFLM